MDLNAVLDAFKALPEKERKKVIEAADEVVGGLLWVPNPGPQLAAYDSLADETFFGGSAGGGKSDLGIGVALNRSRSALILREYKKDAQELGDRLCGIVGSTAGWNRSDAIWRNGSKIIRFDGLPNESDKERWKGRPNDLIVWDELPDFYESQYDFVNGWNRSTDPNLRCRVIATGNPPTRAKGMWVISKWAPWLDPKHPNPAKDGELRWFLRNEDGREIEVDGVGPHLVAGVPTRAKSRTFIRSTLADNPDLARTDYDVRLAGLPKELRDAYREGRFDASLKDHPYQVIPTQWVVEAQKRWTPRPPPGVPMCAIAADIAQGGPDDTVIAKRYGGYFPELVAVPGKQTPLGSDAAALIIAQRRGNPDVCVDMGGGYGMSAYEHLSGNGVEVRGYKGAEGTTRRTTDGKLGFTNVRSAAYWWLREGLDPDQEGGSPIALPPDPKLLAELTTPTYRVIARGIQLMPKEDVAEILGYSPDRADAVVMCWDTGPRTVHAALNSAEQGGRESHGGPKVDMGPRFRGRTNRR